jgi:hypothetical protein
MTKLLLALGAPLSRKSEDYGLALYVVDEVKSCFEGSDLYLGFLHRSGFIGPRASKAPKEAWDYLLELLEEEVCM